MIPFVLRIRNNYYRIFVMFLYDFHFLFFRLTVPRLPINHIIQYVAALRFSRDLELARKALPKRIISGPAAKGKKISKIL